MTKFPRCLLCAFALVLALGVFPVSASAATLGGVHTEDEFDVDLRSALGAVEESPLAQQQKQAAQVSASDSASYTAAPELILADAIADANGVVPLYPFVATKYDRPVSYEKPYIVGVDTVNQVITVVKRGDSDSYDVPVKYFICSTGTKKDPTPDGLFLLSNSDRYDWMYFKKFKCYVRYPVHIFEDYFFHSLIYNKQDVSSLSRSSYNNLGKPASHGCIRMLDDEVKWMSENLEGGTAVIVYAGASDSALNKALKPK